VSYISVITYQWCNCVTECTVAVEKRSSTGEHSVGENDLDIFEEQRYVIFD